ncbi:efflux RND transporter permease subunit [Halobacteriovorax sp. HLS]|uniref:efflux RND transporter permease subunit n=1 Tax=Halobacteriovorax sp. HLS TaxID=2234000 RepID=UPI000FDCBEA1|nr:efflux RND transporter permease subunit [Halobacteriovorax sp. HLS]
MKKIVQYFVDNSFLVNTISLAMVIIGLISVTSMKRDLIPQFGNKQITITANLSGASPYQVEQFLTIPIEDSINSFAGIDHIYSSSQSGRMSISLNVKDSYKDIEDLFEKVKSSLSSISHTLPSEVENLEVINRKMTTFWFSSLAALNYDDNNRVHQNWIKETSKELRKIPGVVEVNHGAPLPNVYIKFDAKKLARYQFDINELTRTLIRRFDFLPLGSISKNGNTVNVEINNDINSVTELEDLIVRGNLSGKIIRLKDVASVEYKIHESDTMSFTNGAPSRGIVLFKDLDTDIIEMKQSLEKKLEKLKSTTPEGIELIVTGDGPAFIERQLNVLNINGLMGAGLVVFILFAFFGLKASLMTSFGLPLAYLATFTVLMALDIKIDLISVAGMLLIVGILVDDAIIVSELYVQNLEKGFSPRESAIKAATDTMIPITGTVLTTVIAFAPILITESGLSAFLRAIPWVVIAALSMSLFECFFLLPNHLSHFVKTPPKHNESSVFNRLSRGYGFLLSKCLKWRYPVLVGMVALLVGTFILNKEKVPFKANLNIGSETIKIDFLLKASNDLENTRQKVQPIWDLLNTVDKSKYTYMTSDLGRNWYNGERKEGYKYGGFNIRFSQTHPNIDKDREFILSFLEKKLELLKTDDFEILSIKKVKDGHDDKKENTFKLSAFIEGQHRDEFIIEQVKQVFSSVKGVKDVYIDPDLISDTWMFEPNKVLLHSYGLSPIDLSSNIQGYIRKSKIKEFRNNGSIVNVYGYFKDGKDLNFEDLSKLTINVDNGKSIALGKLGSWKKIKSLKTISHTDLKKSLNFDISYDESILKKEKIGEILKEQFPIIKKKVPGLKFKLEDGDEQEAKNSKAIFKMMISCIFLILFVLALILRSFSQPLMIGMAIPFGMIGVIWAFYFHGQSIDIMAMVGIMGMAGVVVNDSLIMVDTINKKKAKIWHLTREDIHSGAVSRLRAIIITSITTLGGVFPMAYGIGGDSGFTKSLALSMGWGLLFATALTLLVLPTLLEVQRDFWRVLNKVPLFKNKFSPLIETIEKEQIEDSTVSIDVLIGNEKSNSNEHTIQ